MIKRLVVFPILSFALVLVAPSSAYACGGPSQACCSGNVCTSPAFCDVSNVCVLNNQQSCTTGSDCFSGLCANTSSTPTCGSLECLSAAGQICSADGDCEPGTWCYTVAEGGNGKCTADSVATTGSCAIDGPDECVTFLCDSMTQKCLKGSAPPGDGCFGSTDCAGTLYCCLNDGDPKCASDDCTTAGQGWCCVPAGDGTCTMANELTFCCSGTCNVGTGICCNGSGVSCTANNQCCTNSCSGGHCT